MTEETTNEATTETVEAEEIDWKAKSREWESRAKANKSAADELAALKDTTTTAEQRFEARLAEVENRAVKAETDALRSSIAAAFQINTEDRDLFLTGIDEATLTAQAKRLAEREVDRKKAGNVAPKEGTATESGADEGMREFTRQLFKRAD
jgi:hypothetical protein